MPFKSEAQRRKFYAMAREGKISQETVDRWEKETPKSAKLPERVGKMDKTAAFRSRQDAMVREAGGDLDAVLAACNEELEKIAFLGRLATGVANLGKRVFTGGPSPAQVFSKGLKGSADDAAAAATTQASTAGMNPAQVLSQGFRGAPKPPKVTPKPAAGTTAKPPSEQMAPGGIGSSTPGPAPKPPITESTGMTVAGPAPSAAGASFSDDLASMGQRHFGVGKGAFDDGIGNWYKNLDAAKKQNVNMALGIGGATLTGIGGLGAGALLF